MAVTEAERPLADTAVTRVLAGRYRLIRLVGHGGMGSVYEAVHVHTEKHVAIKLLSPQLSKDLKLVARFRREAMAASRLEHENCVHVDDFGEDADGTFFIVMEFIDGHGLADELRQSGPMPTERVARIGAQLLKALDAAHSAGVLHRDLKPQNVMLTQKPQRPDIVKVVDFGIAKITTNTADDQAALTVPGTIFGTPEYMSPEQARGEILDVRSDLYSAAVVLWHMLLGRSPFRGTSVRETLMRVFSDAAPLPSAERPSMKIPLGFEAALLTAMAKKRDDRYPDAPSFLEALRPYVTGMAVEVPRRPLPGLPVDGSPPPQTLDDNRAATLALPEADLPPLATPSPPMRAAPITSPPPPTVVADVPPVRVAVPAPVTKEPPPPTAARVVTINSLKKPDVVPLAETVVARRKKKTLSSAGVLVLTIAAIGAIFIAAASVSVFYLVSTGFFDKKGPVMDLAPHDKITNTEQDKKHDAIIKDAPAVFDPVARDEALARAEKAIEHGDLKLARAAYADALASDPQAARALIGLATISMQQKNWAAACDAFEKLMPLDAKYARQFGPMYARAKKFRDAP